MGTLDIAKHVLLQSGTGWILWFLTTLGLVSLAIAVERWLYLYARGADLPALAARLDACLARGEREEAQRLLSAERASAARIAHAGLRLADRGVASAEKAMASAVALERTRLERRLAFLGTVGNNAPFIGLFGTVVGIIHAFEELGHGATGHAAGAAGQVASQAVMAAIAEALVATAVGILVALPAVAAYNFLQRRVTSLLAGTEALSNLVLAYVAGEGDSEKARDGRS